MLVNSRDTSPELLPLTHSLMLNYLFRKLLHMLATMAGVVLLVFILFNQVGGDPSYILAGQNATPERIDLIRSQLGIDQPMHKQLFLFVLQVITMDFGKSWTGSEYVIDIFVSRLPTTLALALPILILEFGLGTILALAIVHVRGTLTERLALTACNVAMSISFLVYIIVLQWGLAYKFGLFPVQGWDQTSFQNILKYASLPIIIATLVSIPATIRTFRAVFLDEIAQGYVRTARAKGASEAIVLTRHVLPNGLIPILAYLSVSLPTVVVGTFLLEVYFSIPGLGREIVSAVNRSDFPVIKASVILISAVTMIANLLTDIAYRWLDPRLGFE